MDSTPIPVCQLMLKFYEQAVEHRAYLNDDKHTVQENIGNDECHDDIANDDFSKLSEYNVFGADVQNKQSGLDADVR